MSLRAIAMVALTVAVPALTLGFTALPARAANPQLTVAVDRLVTPTNPTQWGHIIEDISHSVEGGLNSNLVRNPTMKERASNPPFAWSLVRSGTGAGSISTDTSTPLNAANQSSLKLDITANGGTNRIGASNEGFFGVGLRPSTRYTASFFARRSGQFRGSVRVALESTTGTVYAAATTAALRGTWTKYTVRLTTGAGVPVSTANRITFYPNGTGTGAVNLNVVEVRPPPYPGTDRLRSHLMTKLASIKPSFWRVPGGNYLEGQTLATRFDWKATIGANELRAGHQNDAWGYWSSDQVGLKEYLDMAGSTGAEVVLGVFAGYTLNGTVVPKADLQPYIQEALDEIEYVIGDVSTPWGARRAADGHPEPYKLNYVEIGNEDWFDASGSYDAYRFPMFYDAIKRAYPQLKVVASMNVTSRVPDLVDDHFYNNRPEGISGLSTLYDEADRNGPQRLIGEYAVTDATVPNPTGTVAGAVAEASFMTGLLRNADLVVGAAYAPALANVNSYSWSTNLIGFDTVSSFDSPSFYVQQMFGANLGDWVLPTRFEGAPAGVTQVATRAKDGTVYVHVVNPTAAAVTSTVSLSGAASASATGTVTVLTGDPGARNTMALPRTVQPTTSTISTSSTFDRQFPAHSVTLLKLSVTGPVTPALTTNKGMSLRATAAGSTERSVAATAAGGTVEATTYSSSEAARRQATFVPRTGLADSACYSFESRAVPGGYLRRRADNTVVTAASDGSAGFAADATFCPVVGNGPGGLSFTSKSAPDRFLRHFGTTLYTATRGGSAAYESTTQWPADTTFRISSPWWRSDVEVSLGKHSFQATSGVAAGASLRHAAYLGRIDQVDTASSALMREDATFTVVAGLADSSCYSFRSVNYPDQYLRHANFRVRLDARAGTTFDGDATFCAVPGKNGQGVSFRSFNFPDRYLRHFDQEVWIASPGGVEARDTLTNWTDDTSWTVAAPWVP